SGAQSRSNHNPIATKDRNDLSAPDSGPDEGQPQGICRERIPQASTGSFAGSLANLTLPLFWFFVHESQNSARYVLPSFAMAFCIAFQPLTFRSLPVCVNT